jgi:predicted metal-binding protein
MSEPVELLVCLTCRTASAAPVLDPEAPRPGADLLARLNADAPAGVAVRGVECLSNCSRGCTIALRAPGRWTYIYGNIDPARDLAAIHEGALKYAAQPEGLVPWRERPEHFRKNCIARVPPLELSNV